MRDSTDRFDRIDAHLARTGLDGYLVEDDAGNANQRYLSGYDATDPYVTLYTPDGLAMLIKGLEYGRAREESHADAVRRPSDYGYSPYGDPEQHRETVAAFLDDRGVESVAVPNDFPVGTADGLRERGFAVEPDDEGLIEQVRAVKTGREVDAVRATQRDNEAAMRAAEALLAGADVEDGVLYHEGDPLTSERVRRVIERRLLDRGCTAAETIVAGGEQAADPHERGHGPLPAGEPVVVDIFPRDRATKYHADMTRTFVRGTAGDAVRERYEHTRDALQAALDAIEPGVPCGAVHDAVCDVYEAHGYATIRSEPDAETGFIHSTGHGVGLDVHEQPLLGPDADEPLEPGHVVTVEPGLYDPAVGGVRIEDLVAVTGDGYERLTDYHDDLAASS